jgi:hypothetical protein
VTAKKHDPSTRFQELLRRYKTLIPKSEDADLQDPLVRNLRLPLSFSVLPGNLLDDAISMAFSKTDLNIRDPLQWKLLLALFSMAHFATWPPKKGPTKRWTSARLRQLDEHAQEIRSRHPKFSDKAVASVLVGKNPYRDVYGEYSIPSIVERLAEAKTMKRELEALLKAHLTAVRRLFIHFEVEWTSDTEAAVRQSFLDRDREVSAVVHGE